MNDNEPRDQKPIEERFAAALDELIGMCFEAEMHISDFIGPLKKELEWARRWTLKVEIDNKSPAHEIRRALQLEKHEPIPKIEES